MVNTVGKVAWHVHHNTLYEVLMEPIENRIVYIKEEKPEEERKLRLKLLKLIKGPVPKVLEKACKTYIKAYEAYVEACKAYVRTREAFDEAREAFNKASEAYIKAYEAYDKALERNRGAMEAMHKHECPNCPWDGKTIFAK